MACASACGQPSIVPRHDVAAYHRFAPRDIGLPAQLSTPAVHNAKLIEITAVTVEELVDLWLPND